MAEYRHNAERVYQKPVNPEEFERVFQKICGWIQEKDAYFRFVSDKMVFS